MDHIKNSHIIYILEHSDFGLKDFGNKNFKYYLKDPEHQAQLDSLISTRNKIILLGSKTDSIAFPYMHPPKYPFIQEDIPLGFF